ncbi:chromate efflux transporter [Rhizobium sp. SIMBA_035]
MNISTEKSVAGARSGGTPGEIFSAFLKLGVTSFGGPIAHLGYLRDELVVRRRWIDEAGYADLVALCQFLPGPASSQVGFALGLLRGGPFGALAAWTGFTLPSAVLLVIFAMATTAFDGPIGAGLLHGLKVVAVAIVAQAVWGMAKTLTPDRARAGIALAAVLIVTFTVGAVGQVAAIAIGGAAGFILCPNNSLTGMAHLSFRVSPRIGIACLVTFFLLLVGLPIVAATTGSQGINLFDSFFRSGALVFGGGHVVLPLLQTEVVGRGWMTNDVFLAGYSAAQAVPGSLFTFSAYLGAVIVPAPNGILGAAICLFAVFLPGLLLLVGALPFWDSLRQRPLAQATMRGANAAVVGILAAALYNPVWTSAILAPHDFALALTGFLLLAVWKAPPWVVVLGIALAGLGLSLL